MRISKYQYYLLPDDEKSEYTYHSDEIGCYFEKEDHSSESGSEKKVDDFERLTNKKKEG